MLSALDDLNWTPHLLLGFANGSLLSYLLLTNKASIIAGGGVIGIGYSVVYLVALKNFVSDNTAEENKYVDKDFKL